MSYKSYETLQKNIHIYVREDGDNTRCGKSVFTPGVFSVFEDYAHRHYPSENLCPDCLAKSPKIQMRDLAEADL